MEKQLKMLPDEELKERISELEDTYAELLGDGSEPETLQRIWKEIQVLREHLKTIRN